MLTSVRSLLAATVIAGGLLAATPALADDSPISLSANVALVTDYRFRGVGLSGGDPAIQGGIDLSSTPGFYVGTWASSINSPDNGYGDMELDIYGGWKGKLVDGLDGQIGMYWYVYPTNKAPLTAAGLTGADYYEIYGSLSPSIGPASFTFGVNYAPNQGALDFGGKKDNLYLYANAGIGIPSTPISLSGHLGYTDGSLTFTSNSTGWDYSIGASATFMEHFSVGVSYIGVDHTGPSIGGVTDDAVVGTLSASF